MLDALTFVKTPKVAALLFSEAIWKIKTKEKILYLTFDDGPIAEVTPWVLDELNKYHALATFFCIGKNIAAHPDIFNRLLSAGHAIGNHTYDHLNGWNTENENYFENIRLCDVEIKKHTSSNTTRSLFRPPYGKLTPAQYNHLKKEYQLTMWDVLSFDFDMNISKEKVLENVLENVESGSIILFHDSLKAKEKIMYALPKVLEHFSNLGYRFHALHNPAVD